MRGGPGLAHLGQLADGREVILEVGAAEGDLERVHQPADWCSGSDDETHERFAVSLEIEVPDDGIAVTASAWLRRPIELAAGGDLVWQLVTEQILGGCTGECDFRFDGPAAAPLESWDATLAFGGGDPVDVTLARAP